MTSLDAKALLRDILLHPDDDVPRLVYADWLEEYGGKSERAEYIRWEVVHSTYVNPDMVTHAAWKMWPDSLTSILGVEDPSRHGWSWTWHRGFIRVIACTCEAFEKHAEALFLAHPITEVMLTDRSPSRQLSINSDHPWYWEEHRHLEENRCLPLAIIDLLTGWKRRARRGELHGVPSTQQRFYVYKTDAIAALSPACVLYGRKLRDAAWKREDSEE